MNDYVGTTTGQGGVAGVSMDMLQNLLKDTEASIQTLEKPAQRNLDTKLDELKAKFEQAEQIKDKHERDIRMKVLKADFASLRESIKEEEADLANAVFGLNAILESMGAEYAVLMRPNAEELKLVTDAEAKLGSANVKLEEAGQKWNFLHRREKAIAQANQAITNAKQGIEDAKAEAKRRARRRLQTKNMEESLQDFQYKVEQTIGIMEKRKEAIEKQLVAVQTRKAEAFRIKEEAARALEALDQQLQEKEAELQTEEEMFGTFLNGSPEYAAQDTKVSNLRSEVEDIRGRRNTALILFQSKEKFAEELQVHERTQMKLRDNHIMWITALRSDTQERVVTFKSRLEAMKAMSDQDIAKQLDDMGAAIDQSNVEYMASAGAASDNVRMQKVENQPDRVAKVIKAAAAQAEAIQQIR
ncbi:MAG: hypothetical protein WA019_00085, partial [Candidatus Moraniibacteriota bacterium]